jgi:hypothetical protein
MHTVLRLRSALLMLRLRLTQEAGEGVISAAIAVLIMAFLGVAMWVAFNEVFQTAADTVAEQVREIGS